MNFKLGGVSQTSLDTIWKGVWTPSLDTLWMAGSNLYPEFLLYRLHMSYFRKRKSKTIEVSFCGIAIKHHIPEWYDI